MKKPDPSTHLHLTLCPTPFFLPFLPSPHSVSAKSFFSSSFERALRAEPKVGGKEGRKNLLGPMGTLRNLSFILAGLIAFCARKVLLPSLRASRRRFLCLSRSNGRPLKATRLRCLLQTFKLPFIRFTRKAKCNFIERALLVG